MPRRAILAAYCCIVVAGSVSAEPYVEHLEPPSVARGAAGVLAVVGSSVDRPVGLWTSLPAGKLLVERVVSSSPERTEFTVRVTADCPVGLYGLRLATEDGLSNLCLFAVDDLPPKTALADPQREFPASVAGEFKPAGVDRYRIQVAAGQTLSFDVIASRLGMDADPLLTIIDPSGKRLAQQDNDPGLFFDCCFEQTFAQAGVYTVELRDARYQGSPHWRYVLRMGAFPAVHVAIPAAVKAGETAELLLPELAGTRLSYTLPPEAPPGTNYWSVRRPADAAANWVPVLTTNLRSAVEAEPNDKPEAATPAGEAAVLLHGVIGQAGDLDQFLLSLKAGQKLTLRAETRPLGSAADVELALFDATGRELQRNDDVTLPGGLLEEATLNVNINKDGDYRLQVREMSESGGPQYSYRVEVRPVTPRIQISSEISAFTLPQQESIRLPIAVTRNDYNGPIELALSGAPDGVRLEPSTILEGATSLDARLLAAGNAPLGIHTFTIEAKSTAGDLPLTARLSVQPLVDRQLLNVDLIKYALRDNQRYLPPSVTNCVALQITPPAPFTVELAEPLVTLPRYLQTEVKIGIGRKSGFEGALQFAASGGQLGEESQGRRQVFGRYPVAEKGQTQAVATIHSRSQAQEAKERIDLTATGVHNGREVKLVRSFTLDCRPGFAVTCEPSSLVLPPGGVGQARLVVNRLPQFNGEVTVERAANFNLLAPETLLVPAGQDGVAFEVTVPADAKPGKQRLRFTASGQVGAFVEEPRPLDFEVEIKVEKKP